MPKSVLPFFLYTLLLLTALSLPVVFQILKIHLFGQPATGDLKRPFEAPAGMFGGGAPAANETETEAPAVEAKKEAKKDK